LRHQRLLGGKRRKLFARFGNRDEIEKLPPKAFDKWKNFSDDKVRLEIWWNCNYFPSKYGVETRVEVNPVLLAFSERQKLTVTESKNEKFLIVEQQESFARFFQVKSFDERE
jgi:hypothetical protein